MRKKGLYILLTAMILVWLMGVVIVTESFIDGFSYVLFQRRDNLVSSGILLELLKRIVTEAVLATLGFACIALYLLSYGKQRFLILSISLFACSGWVATIYQQTVIFLSGRQIGGIWNHLQDIYLILTLISVFSVSIYKQAKPRLKILNRIFLIASVPVIGLCIFSSILMSNRITQVYCFAYFLIMLLNSKQIGVLESLIHLCIFCCAVISSIGKFAVFSFVHILYKDFCLFAWPGILIVFFFIYYQKERTGHIFGGEVSQKIKEICSQKEKVTELIISQCDRPIGLIQALCFKMEKFDNYTEEQKQILEELLRNTRMIKSSLYDISDYALLNSSIIADNHKNPVDLYSILKNALSDVESDNCVWKYNCHITTDNLEVRVEPFQLIDINKKILYFLYECSVDKKLDISFWDKENMVGVNFKISYKKEMRRIIKAAEKITRSRRPYSFEPDFFAGSHILLPFAVVVGFIRLNEGIFNICRQGNEVIFSYQLERDINARSGNKNGDRELSKVMHHILLISDLPQQVDLLERYLQLAEYDYIYLDTSNDVLGFMKQNSNINLIILGNLFGRWNMNELCNEIRKIYSAEELPILAIVNERKLRLNSRVLGQVNDVLFEPFEYDIFIRKISSLLVYRDTIRESKAARVDLLQYQMDPHFIFNTLSTIMPLCMESPQEAYDLLGYFSDYLRSRLYHKGLNITIPLEDELEHIEAYCYIQNVRYKHTIEYELQQNVQSGLSILPLMLEPLVENSINHGMIKGKSLHIILEITEHDSEVYFAVWDNGSGISEEEIVRICSDDSDNKSIGLRNLRQRLAMYYNSSLHISSNSVSGTKISFVLQKDRM